MGVVRTEVVRRAAAEDLHRLLACAGLHRRKPGEEFNALRAVAGNLARDLRERVVCVTSGASFLGLALVDRLLARGYRVRILVDNHEDIEKLREMMSTRSSNLSAVITKLTDARSLVEAFEGCCGVFHTMAFTDPAGLSGYSKSMSEIEAIASETVMKACARTTSVRNCVLTSSLLACLWREGSHHELSSTIDHNSWSEESFCMDKKLWYALGKLRAEKTAWRVAEETGLKLASICPGLITGPEFCRRNPTGTIAYLKGAQEMYAEGVLATVDVFRLAEAHVYVFQAMNDTAAGRYICFDRVIATEDAAAKLANDVGIPLDKIHGNGNPSVPTRFQLSNRKLTSLMSETLRPCYNES